MRNIASYYLHNVGFVDLWFMDILTPCLSPVTNDPVHTLLGAGNGCGKSTTIALLFSLFVPDRGRFLRTQKDTHYAFEDYFDKHYYKPGFVIIELDAGPSVNLPEGERERIIVGQAVCLSQSNNEYLYRRFFAFRAACGLDMQALLKGTDGIKALKDINSQIEFKEWLKAMRAKAPHDQSASFYDTDNQQDWLRHLSGRGIDNLLTNLQWRYNRREGGFEVKDANSFVDHRDFFRRFIDMCLNESTAVALKKNIESNIKNLADVPRYEEQLAVFRSMEEGFEPFRLAARNLQEAKASRDNELQEARGLLLALERKVDSVLVKQKAHERNITTHEERARKAEENRVDAENRKRGLEKALHEAKIRDNQRTYDVALDASQQAKANLEIRKARNALKELDIYAADIAEIRQQLDLVSAEVKVFQDRAKDAGARYRSALINNRAVLTTDKSKSERVAQFIEKAQKALSQQMQHLDKDSRTVTQNIANISARQDQAEKNRQRLLDDGVMFPKESGKEAVRRLQDQLGKLQKEERALDESISRIEGQIQQLQQERNSKDKERTSLKLQAQEKAREYARGENIANELIKQIHKGGLVDTLEADLESPLVERKLDKQQDLLEEKAASLAIKKGTLENDRTCVERFKVLGVDHNVTSVTRALTDVGIKAMPYGAYLASVLADDPETARAVFLSDPARFSGVQVLDEAALEAARTLKGVSLDRPVVVSLATDTPNSVQSESVVVGHEGHALYNKPAAQEFSEQLDGRIRNLERTQEENRKRAKSVADWLSRLASYVAEFGNGKLKAIKTQEKQFLRQAGNISDWLDNNQESLKKMQASCVDQKQTHAKIVGESQKEEASLRRVREYINDFESNALKWEREVEQFRQEQSDLQARLLKIKGYQKRVGQSLVRYSGKSIRLEGEIKHIDKLLPKIDYDSGERHDVGTNYEPLQKVYEDAAGTLKAKEGGKVLDLTGSLKTKNEEHQKRLQEYRQNFEKFDEVSVRAVPIEGIDSQIQEATTCFEQAQSAVSSTRSALDTAKGAYKSDLDRWERDGLTVTSANIDASLSQETIQEIITEAAEEVEVSVCTMEEEKREIDSQKQLADKAARDRVCYTGAQALVKGAAEQLAEIKVIPKSVEAPSLEMVESTAQSQQRRLNKCIKTVSDFERRAEKTHSALMRLLESDEVRAAAPYESSLMRQAGIDNYEAFVADADDKARIITDRIKMLVENIARSEESLQSCAVALSGGVEHGLRLLKHAVKFRVPETVSFLGGQQVLKISNLDKLSKSQVPLNEHLKRFIKRLVVDGGSLPSGHRLVADALCHAAEQMAVSLKVRILKPVPALGRFDHVDISTYNSSSGGEGLTSALMYYLLAAHIRGKEQGKNVNFGGALILDNPIGEANLPSLLQAQREIATNLGIQLIYFTGINDMESLKEFDHHVTLRPSKKEDRASGRRYMEIWYSEMQSGKLEFSRPVQRKVPVEA